MAFGERNLGEKSVDFAVTDVRNRRSRAVHRGAVHRTQGFDGLDRCEGDSRRCPTTIIFLSSIACAVPGKVYDDVVATFDIRVVDETVECFNDVSASRRGSVKVKAI